MNLTWGVLLTHFLVSNSWAAPEGSRSGCANCPDLTNQESVDPPMDLLSLPPPPNPTARPVEGNSAFYRKSADADNRGATDF